MIECVIDIEGDSLTPSKIHCMSYSLDGNPITNFWSEDSMKYVAEKDFMFIGHNFIRFDKPVIERILNCRMGGFVVDTLALSWYLYPTRVKHGLEEWGVYFNYPKVAIDDWVNLPLATYVERCKTDVEINQRLWDKIKRDLLTLYNGDWDECMRLIKYLMFKMDCARLQEERAILLDTGLAEDSLADLEALREEKLPELVAAMPSVRKYATKTRPEKFFKKNGDVAVAGAKWRALCREYGYDEDYDGEIMVLASEEPGNPNSPVQVKDWLFSLGWIPEHYKYVREDRNVRKIPQIKSEFREGELCDSVLALAEDHPEVNKLQGLGIINHRIGIFKSYLNNCSEDGYVTASIAGFTNTLRYRHKAPLVNLPGVTAFYGKEIRGCLKARVGYEFCGSDQTSLETNTKLHYMWEHDPAYVLDQKADGFDPHLDLAVIGGDITQWQADQHIRGEADYSGIRRMYKVVNYSCTYGAQAETVARAAKCSVAKGQQLVDAYWQRNQAIVTIADNVFTKKIGNQLWLYNPVSRFWYSLRHVKDIFSTLNQGTGVYCFDTWVKHILAERPQLSAQFHDEILIEIKEGHREECKALLNRALDRANLELNLNVVLGISIDFGKTYAEVH